MPDDLRERDRGQGDPHLSTGAYALDALDDVENAAVERHLLECAACASEVAEFREVAARMAAAVAVPPPDGMRSAVLAAVRTQRQVPVGRRGSRPGGFRFRRPLIAAAAASTIAATTLLGGLAWQSRQDGQEARELAAQVSRVLTDPDRTDVAGPVSVGGEATVVAAGGDAVFAASGLPAPGADQAYQLWVVEPTGIRSAGLLTLERGATQAYVEGVSPGETVAVSVEPEGGSDQPTTTPVVALDVS